ncbi:hypothetical protein ACFQ0B_41425 [Nonomuraea thailandensis]
MSCTPGTFLDSSQPPGGTATGPVSGTSPPAPASAAASCQSAGPGSGGIDRNGETSRG